MPIQIKTKSIPPFIKSEARILEEKLVRDKSVRNLWNMNGYWSNLEKRHDKMGWLWLPFDKKDYEKFGSRVRKKYDWVILIGIGGAVQAFRSYLAMFGYKESPEGFWKKKNKPTFFILDTSCPETLMKLEKMVDLDKTFFIYSSKAGKAPEPAAVYKYFLDKSIPEKFLIITDPYLPLDRKAGKTGVKVFHSKLDVPGRMNPLSTGMRVFCAIAGIPITNILISVRRNLPQLRANKNPATKFASIFEALRRNIFDKIITITSRKCRGIPFWLDQIIHENLGKDCKGFLCLREEKIANLQKYGKDRIFLSLATDNESKALNSKLENLESKFPLINIKISSEKEIGFLFFFIQFTSFLCAELMKVNPLIVPGVMLSKEKIKDFIKRKEPKGENIISFPDVKANLNGIVHFLTKKKCKEIAEIEPEKMFQSIINELKKIHEIQFIGLLPYLDRNKKTWDFFKSIADSIRRKTKLATYFGFGPGWQHSALQYFQEGPNKGFFFLIDKKPTLGLRIPKSELTFDEFISLQASAAAKALSFGRRPVVRLTLRQESKKTLSTLRRIILQSFEPIGNESNWS